MNSGRADIPTKEECVELFKSVKPESVTMNSVTSNRLEALLTAPSLVNLISVDPLFFQKKIRVFVCAEEVLAAVELLTPRFPEVEIIEDSVDHWAPIDDIDQYFNMLKGVLEVRRRSYFQFLVYFSISELNRCQIFANFGSAYRVKTGMRLFPRWRNS